MHLEDRHVNHCATETCLNFASDTKRKVRRLLDILAWVVQMYDMLYWCKIIFGLYLEFLETSQNWKNSGLFREKFVEKQRIC